MTKKYLLILVVVVVMIGLILTGCAKPAPAPAPAPAPTPAPTGPEEIRVGTVTSLTGMYAGFGQGAAFGVKMSVDDINKQGGIYVKEYDRKLPVKLLLLDDESDPLKTGILTEDLILSDKINFFLKAHAPPPTSAAAAIVCDRYKMPNFGGGGPFEPWMGLRESTETHWPYTWVIGLSIATPAPEGDPRYGIPGYTVLDIWKGSLDKFADQTNKKVGVFASDDPDGAGWYASFPAALKEWGYDVVGVENKVGLFPLDTTDYSAMVEYWKDNDVEILWGCCPAPHFGTMWRQCHTLDFKPKAVYAAKAALFYTEVIAWGGDLPNAVCIEENWLPIYKDSPGIGDETPQSLLERWTEETGQPLNQAMGWSYAQGQVMFNAIERAGTLDGDAVNKAIGETNMMTVTHLVMFDKATQFSWAPLALMQWHKTDKPQEWDNPVVYSDHDFIPVTAEMLFPIPY